MFTDYSRNTHKMHAKWTRGNTQLLMEHFLSDDIERKTRNDVIAQVEQLISKVLEKN